MRYIEISRSDNGKSVMKLLRDDLSPEIEVAKWQQSSPDAYVVSWREMTTEEGEAHFAARASR